MTTTAAPALRFGSDVHRNVRVALAADPAFIHPDFRDHPVWVIRDGHPRRARIVGCDREAQSWTARAYDVLAEGEAVVLHVSAWALSWSAEDAAAAQAELDEAFDL